ncbi:MAG: tetratricopeptide repeat protein [Aeoliella sp.]
MVYVLIIAHIIHWQVSGRTLAPLEVSEALETIHLGIITAGAIFLLATILITLFFGRFFCGWACHILALQDFCHWLLDKCGIRPKPIRSRVLVWVPLLAAIYLFVWPQVERLITGEPFPELRFQTDAEGWGSLVTEDFWRKFPGVFISVLTFVVCGFVVVYVLGTRSFCRFACPYGAIFHLADRITPGRIVMTGDCQQCGKCTAGCLSQVRVHEEIKRYGMVVDSNCMKDLDCVSNCPNSAIEFKFAKPPIAKGILAPARLEMPPSFTRAEDGLIAVVFVTTLIIYRGLYDALPLLLSLSIAGLLGYIAVLCVRTIRNATLRVNKVTLKQDGRLTARGIGFALLAIGLAALTVHSGFVRYHDYLGQRAYGQANAQTAHELISKKPSVLSFTLARRAIYHLEIVSKWGLVKPLRVRHQLAALYIATVLPESAERELQAILKEEPNDLMARTYFAATLAKQGKLDEAATHLEKCVALRPDSPDVRNNLAYVYTLLERNEEAIYHFEWLLDITPRDALAHCSLGALLQKEGRLEEAAAAFRRATELQPTLDEAARGLESVLDAHRRQTSPP